MGRANVLSLVTFFARSKESDSLAQRVKALSLTREDQKKSRWIPAFTGMTSTRAGFQLSLE
jgi:hypothetical protein